MALINERLSICITVVLMHMSKFFVSSSIIGLPITDVLLYNSNVPNEGTIAIRQGNEGWQTICGNILDIKDVTVICKQLGFPGASRAIENSPFDGFRDYPSSEMGLVCRGDETHLYQCPLLRHSPCTRGAASCYGIGYIGCFRDDDMLTVLSGTKEWDDHLRISFCIDSCYRTFHGSGSDLELYRFAGVHNGSECRCGLASDDYARLGRGSDEDCQTPCPGDPTQSCGGVGYTAIFTTDGQSGPVADDPVTTPGMPGPCHKSTAWTMAALIVGIILALAVLYGNIIITLMYLHRRRSQKDDGQVLPELVPMHEDVK